MPSTGSANPCWLPAWTGICSNSAATAAKEHATSVTPRVSEADVAAERKAAAVKRNIDAQKRTPPAQGSGNGTSGGQLGGGLTGAQLKAMSDEDFDKLSDRDLAKIRGDEL